MDRPRIWAEHLAKGSFRGFPYLYVLSGKVPIPRYKLRAQYGWFGSVTNERCHLKILGVHLLAGGIWFDHFPKIHTYHCASAKD